MDIILIFEIIAGMAVGLVAGIFISKQGNNARNAEFEKELLEQEQSFQADIHSKEKELTVLHERIHYFEKEISKLSDELIFSKKEYENRLRELAVSSTENKNLKEKLENQKVELENIQNRLKTEFENLANKILNNNSKEFAQSNRKSMDEILNPLKDKIHSFEKKVEDAYDKELRDKISLKEEVRKLYDLNSKISTEAQNLTKALKGDVKKQGNWGEVILERILERSGLTKGSEYEREVVANNEDGKQIRPDVIIHLPEDKHIIIDSKVSLVAYERYVNAESDTERDKALKEHILSLKNHIKHLGDKHYESSAKFNTPDFVLLFVPIESSFALAVNEDRDLFNLAWENKIVVVSPSTLLATLRTIASVWKQEYQNRNVMEIAEHGGKLYDEFVRFCEDMQKLGKKLEEANSAYNSSYKRLSEGRGNLVKRAEKMKALGAKAKKQLPEEFRQIEGED